MDDAVDDVKSAFAGGASGYVLKTAADEELVHAIRAVTDGETYLDPSLGAKLARPSQPSPIDELSPRERDVLRLLALGYTNQEVADQLIVGVRTVESHRANLMAKLRLGTRAEMVQVALSGGLLDEDRA
jgi:two-component system response regulator NreC